MPLTLSRALPQPNIVQPAKRHHTVPESGPKDLGASLGAQGLGLVKNRPTTAGDAGSIPGSGWSPAEGNGNLLQCSCLGNPMDRGAQRAALMGLQSWTWLSAKWPKFLMSSCCTVRPYKAKAESYGLTQRPTAWNVITEVLVELNYSKNILTIKTVVLDSLGRFKGK